MSQPKKRIIKKKKPQRKMTPFLKLLCVGIICVSLYFLYTVVSEIYTTIQLKGQLEDVQAQLIEVQDENAYLTSQRDKLEDPDYVQSYARGNYMLTKDGEQIYYLPADDNK